MFIGQLKVSRNGRSYTYHRLLESVRTAKGPRQRLVLSLALLICRHGWPNASKSSSITRNGFRLGLLTWTRRRRSPNASANAAQAAAPASSPGRTRLRRRSIPHAASELIRELGPESRARVLGAPALRSYPAALRIPQRQCRLAEIQVVGETDSAAQSSWARSGWVGRTAPTSRCLRSPKDALYRVSSVV